METTEIYKDYIGVYRDYRVYFGGYIGIMEKKMETTIIGFSRDYNGIFWGYIGIMEKNMETIIVCSGSVGLMV